MYISRLNSIYYLYIKYLYEKLLYQTLDCIHINIFVEAKFKVKK